MGGDGPRRDEGFLRTIASRFYLEGASQTQIAKDLDLDPSTVSRLLKRAREAGIVHIEIRWAQRIDDALGRELADRYHLARAIVTDGEGSFTGPAADYVSGLLRSGMRVGLGWGETLSGVVDRMSPGSVADLQVVQLEGGLPTTVPGIQGNEIVRQMASKFPRSTAQYIHAPATVESPETCRLLLDEATVRAALTAAGQCDLAIVGIGEMDEEATMFRGGHVSPVDREGLLAAGAVGCMNSRFYDSDGRPVSYLEDRTIALRWDDLTRIPLVVAVAGGREKVAAIRGALRSGCLDALVTDAAAAGPLLH